jgi:2-oxo-4-hydroxy-4-carboxy-5-ureidoimidazoline decarboxylase
MMPVAERPGKLSLAAANALSSAAFRDHFSGVFEHTHWVMNRIEARRPFASRAGLLAVMERVLAEADDTAKLALLQAHPVLGGAAARTGQVTAESAAEQAGHGLDRMAGEEAGDFEALNRDYLERFGFPFIIAVRGQRDRAAILAALRRRLASDAAAERVTALAEVTKIAAFRVEALVEEESGDATSPSRLSLSLHVLDTARGGPGTGLAFTFHRVEAGARGAALGAGETDGAGRWALGAAVTLTPGLYEICFAAGAYQHRFGESGFYDDITIRFRTVAEGGHYHIPLILSPFGYTTYRGG